MSAAQLIDLQEALLLVFRPLFNIYMAFLLVGGLFAGVLAGILEVTRQNKI
jgi:hypothetical protein